MDVVRTVEITSDKTVLNITPANTQNDLLVLGEDGQVYAAVSVRYPTTDGRWYIRWQVSAFDMNGQELWQRTSDRTQRDIADGIVARTEGGIYVIARDRLIAFDPKGNLDGIDTFETRSGASDNAYVFGEQIALFNYSEQTIEMLSRTESSAPTSLWEMPLVEGASLSSLVLRRTNSGAFVLGATDFNSANDQKEKQVYVGLINETGGLDWFVELPVTDVNLADIRENGDGFIVLLSRGYGRSKDDASIVLHVSGTGEILDRVETDRGLRRLGEGVVIASHGAAYVYGSTRNIPPRRTAMEEFEYRDEPWIGRIEFPGSGSGEDGETPSK
jgi:hypothetical protein